ncbi:MAG: hypothetical protein Q9O24_07160 [Gammaproteobacteria bacterium]|nr:hypothetical protein [Gammaproteobacteria bacterium]
MVKISAFNHRPESVFMLPTALTSPDNFRHSFSDGLLKLLDYPELGSFILVLANAHFDQRLQNRLQKPLQQRYQQLKQADHSSAAADDLVVFSQLVEMGLENIEAVQFKQLDDWQLQFNPLRALRPQRLSNSVIDSLQRPFNDQGFHFDKAFLKKEIFWSGELLGRRVDLFYNKFPFANLHSLLVIETEQHHPQYLQKSEFDYLWQLTQQLEQTLSGVGFSYNAYGAYSSVNHLHFQMFIAKQELPLTSRKWQHNGGATPYPSHCFRFDDPAEAWQSLQNLHQQQQSYNFVCLANGFYLLPRRLQGSYQHQNWTAGFAWAEMSGAFITFDKQRFEQLTTTDIEEEFKKLRLPISM